MAQHRCEYPSGCTTVNGVKLVELENGFHEIVRHWYCRAHIAFMRDHPELVQERIGKARTAYSATNAVLTPEQLHVHPAHVQLAAHQRICDPCGAVRDWIAERTMGGQITTASDVEDVGRYVMDHSCPEGVRLNYQVGLVMKGLRP